MSWYAMGMGEERYDAIVVGAGPAGSAAARGIAQGGFRVLLLEEHTQIGVPLHCSGLVTPRTLEEAGLDNGLVLNRVVGAHIYAPSGRRLTLGNGLPRALVIDRVGLDRALAESAQESGAELMTGGRLLDAHREKGGVALAVRRKDAVQTLRTRLLIGADGAHSRVARAMGMGGPVERVLGLGAEGLLPGADREHVQVFVGNAVAPGWFAWTIPLGNGRVRLGIGASRRVKPLAATRLFFDAYARHLGGWQQGRWTGGVIPIWSKRVTVKDNVMLVGDAAGQVKPTSGGGIYPSLVSARLASQAARVALTADDLSERSLRAYPVAWDKTFGREFRRGADLRRVYKTMTDEDFDRLLRIFGAKPLLSIINRHGDIDYPGGMFRRMAGATPALWAFVRGPLRYGWLWR
ncbi:MAG: NAD(P)/FAD-dependent oxidoreductase [Chloroflexi bacterium]|nr:NAD(P)/FAD-dependent oxidoreductase [Chloroflexota bacterium]